MKALGFPHWKDVGFGPFVAPAPDRLSPPRASLKEDIDGHNQLHLADGDVHSPPFDTVFRHFTDERGETVGHDQYLGLGNSARGIGNPIFGGVNPVTVFNRVNSGLVA